MAFICGSSPTQEDDFEALCIAPSTPQRKITRRRHSFGSRTNKDSKNPYSNRGLDKFEALLADLDGKRQQIYTQKGSEDISLVRFMYTNSNDVKPIVVKVHRKQEKLDHQQHQTHNKLENVKSPVLSPDHPVGGGKKNSGGGDTSSNPQGGKKGVISFDVLRRKFGELWRPWYILPLFVILILVFLVFFGRSFAILCTSIGWYLVPAINQKSENPKRPQQKKNVKKAYSRKSSEKIITSPRSVLNSGPMNGEPHRRSF